MDLTTKRKTLGAERAREIFSELHGNRPRVFRAPGRVNLIGEHTDYNDGFVMPAAIEFYTFAAVGSRADRKLSVYSDNFGEAVEFDLDRIESGPTGHWSDYVRGVAGVLLSKGTKLRGANLVLRGEVPIGAGLSSSAALEVAVANALLASSGVEMDRAEIARVCQKAEHEYAGTLCGIMDQFISCFGRQQHALMLDCRSLSYQLLPLDDNARLVICNTNVKHELAGGEYNLRRASCEDGVRILRKHLPKIRALRDVTPYELEQFAAELPETTYRRCRHVVSEDVRVEEAAKALSRGDMKGFGGLMAKSHRSLRDDYEVSCAELDTMVEIAAAIDGVYGARMTGGGFGGCTVNLVKAGAVEAFTSTIKREYQRMTRLAADVYVCSAAEAAGEVVEDGAR